MNSFVVVSCNYLLFTIFNVADVILYYTYEVGQVTDGPVLHTVHFDVQGVWDRNLEGTTSDVVNLPIT